MTFQTIIGTTIARPRSRAILSTPCFPKLLTRRKPLIRLRVATLARPRKPSQISPIALPAPSVTKDTPEGPGTRCTDIMKKIHRTRRTRIAALSAALTLGTRKLQGISSLKLHQG